MTDVHCVGRTRSSKGSGKAKKGGAGGKYTWEGAGGALTSGDALEVTRGHGSRTGSCMTPARHPKQRCARMYHIELTTRRWQMDPNDPNYDPDEDEPRRAPVDLHAGKDADVAAYKQAVRAPGACPRPDMLACSTGLS